MRGTWVAQSAKHLLSAQVMIPGSRDPGIKLYVGVPAGETLLLPLPMSLPHVCVCVCVCLMNK